MSLRYLLSSLEPLDFEAKPNINTLKVIEMFQLNFSKGSFAKFRDLQLLIDVQNLMQGFFDRRLDSRSSKNNRLFEKEILQGEAPLFLEEFFKKHSTIEKRIDNFSALFCSSLEYIQKKHGGFLQVYCKSERQLMAFLTAYRAFVGKKNIARELAFEDASDLFITSLMDQEGHFSSPYEFHDLFEKLKACQGSPLKEYKAVAQYRFDCYYDCVKDYGSLENAVLAYFVSLMILEDKMSFDSDEGLAIVKRLVESEYATE